MRKRFSKKQGLQICKEYFSKGKPGAYILAKKWNCSHSVIASAIRRNGYVLNSRGKALAIFTKEQEQQICKEYFSEEKPSTAVLAKKWNCHYTTIDNIIKRNGYKPRAYRFTKEEAQQIYKQYFSKKEPSANDLAKKWNCGETAIRSAIIRNGYKLRPPCSFPKGNKPWNKNILWSKEAKRKMKIKMKKVMKNPEIREKIREKTLQQIQTQHGPYKDTKPEIAMQDILTFLHIPYEKQFRIKGKGHNYDLHPLNTNILIEVDGDYFHGNLKVFNKLNKFQIMNKQKDLKNNRLAKDNNYILLRFWENDILNNPEKVIKKLAKHGIIKTRK